MRVIKEKFSYVVWNHASSSDRPLLITLPGGAKPFSLTSEMTTPWVLLLPPPPSSSFSWALWPTGSLVFKSQHHQCKEQKKSWRTDGVINAKGRKEEEEEGKLVLATTGLILTRCLTLSHAREIGFFPPLFLSRKLKRRKMDQTKVRGHTELQ